MNNIYQTPESNLSIDDEQTIILRQLFKEQSLVTMVLVSIFGLIPTLLFTFFLAIKDQSFIWMIFLPGICFGFFVKFLTRTFSFKLRLIPAVLLALGLALFVLRFNFNPLMLLIALSNGILVLILSKRPLSEDQQRALYLYRIGRVQL